MTSHAIPEKSTRPTTLLRWVYTLSGLLSLLLGLIGALLPVMPTTPFILLAAFFFARSSPALHRWMLKNRMAGPMIRDWQNHGAIRPRAKVLATVMIIPLCAYSVLLVALPLWLRLGVLAVCGGVLYFIWSRPSRPGSAVRTLGADVLNPKLLRNAAAESEH